MPKPYEENQSTIWIWTRSTPANQKMRPCTKYVQHIRRLAQWLNILGRRKLLTLNAFAHLSNELIDMKWIWNAMRWRCGLSSAFAANAWSLKRVHVLACILSEKRFHCLVASVSLDFDVVLRTLNIETHGRRSDSGGGHQLFSHSRELMAYEIHLIKINDHPFIK